MIGTAGRALHVGITGVGTDLGRGLLPLLEADPGVASIVAFGIRSPPEHPKLSFAALELTRPGSEAKLAEALKVRAIDVLYHLAFASAQSSGPRTSHELDVIGSMQVLAAAGHSVLGRLVVPSSTALYGAQAGGPALLTERHPLVGSPGTRAVTDRIEVEHHVEQFTREHPRTQVIVLRFAPVVGPRSDNTFARLLRAPVVPTMFGYDPLWQTVAEEDAAQALHLALTSTARGPINIVGDEVLPLSAMVQLARSCPLPLPHVVLRQGLKAVGLAQRTQVPAAFLSYLRHSWVADGAKAASALGYQPRVPVRQALDLVRQWGT
jgi:UDP-glucose 4-epimerase